MSSAARPRSYSSRCRAAPCLLPPPNHSPPTTVAASSSSTSSSSLPTKIFFTVLASPGLFLVLPLLQDPV
ncbi:hypothetical protein VPH35_136758 [Triticum aestivum]